MLELSSCEHSEYYYEDILYALDKNIKVLNIDVDRGVNYQYLGELLKEFTTLETLKLTQNYADPETTLDDFLIFIKALKVKEFILEDLQSVFLPSLKLKDLNTDVKISIIYGFDGEQLCLKNY